MSRSTLASAKIFTRALMGVALVTGTAGAGMLLPQVAVAQEAGKLSKGFNEAAAPMDTAFTAAKENAAFANADAATKASMLTEATAALMQAESAIENATDRLTWGQYAYNIATQSADRALQRRGIGAMLESGLVTGENFIALNEAAGQFAYNDQDWATARTYLQAAIDAGSTNSQISGLIAETYIKEGNGSQGLAQLEQVIAQRAAASATGYADENAYKRGLKLAYDAGDRAKAAQYALTLAEAYPNETNFGDAIVLMRSAVTMDDQASLDLMRLMMRTDTFRNSGDYEYYANLADPRRLPGEVVDVIDAGIAAGVLTSGNVAEVRAEASGRVAADRASLPELERDARASSANVNTIMAAGDAYLSYGMADKAEDMYRLAVDKPGVDMGRALTRLGIALADQGMYAEAQEVFGQVTGQRETLARLWAAYAASQAG